MSGELPPGPKANRIRTSLVDSGWDDAPEPPREVIESVTEVDALLEDHQTAVLSVKLPPVPVPPPPSRRVAPPAAPLPPLPAFPPLETAAAPAQGGFPPEPAASGGGAVGFPLGPAGFSPEAVTLPSEREPLGAGSSLAPLDVASFRAPATGAAGPAAPPVGSLAAPSPGKRGASPLALVGAGVFALGLGVLGFVLGRAGRTPEHAPLAAARVSANAPVAGAPTPSAAPPVPTTLLERAAAGDNEALGDLEARAPTERSTDEALALAAGRATERLGDLAALGKTIRDEPEKLADRATRQKLIAAARDGASYREAQRIFASLPGSEGADLLYEVWTGTRQRTPATELAESLVWSKEVRGRASPALALALELRAPTSCEDAQKLLAKALELGDRRAVPLLVRLTVKRGCGESKREDCYPCLRADKNAVADAVKAARGRPPPF